MEDYEEKHELQNNPIRYKQEVTTMATRVKADPKYNTTLQCDRVRATPTGATVARVVAPVFKPTWWQKVMRALRW